MTAARAGAWLIVLLGMAGIAFGAMTYAGAGTAGFFKQLWARGVWNYSPSASVAMVPIGLGIFLVGLALLIGKDWPFAAAFVAMGIGGLIYITNPRWLRPRWTRPR